MKVYMCSTCILYKQVKSEIFKEFRAKPGRKYMFNIIIAGTDFVFF